MMSDKKASPTIVDSNQVVLGPHRIRRITSVQQNYLNTGAIECSDDAIVDGILCRREFERCEENAGYFLRDIFVAKMLGFFLLLGGLSHRVTPEQGVRLR